MPDLPTWMFYRFDDESQTGMLYGSPVSDGDIELEVIALNSRTYDTTRDSFKVTVIERESKWCSYYFSSKSLVLNPFINL